MYIPLIVVEEGTVISLNISASFGRLEEASYLPRYYK